jgi:hypothetical protein
MPPNPGKFLVASMGHFNTACSLDGPDAGRTALTDTNALWQNCMQPELF